MKLSEAIRAGAKIRPQTHGSFYKAPWYSVFWPFTKKRSCALGAAYEAGGAGDQIVKLSQPEISRTGVALPAGTVVRRLQNQPEWNPVYFTETVCPQCEKADGVHNLIPHLNDHHRWTREEIALWVARIEDGQERGEIIKRISLSEGDGTKESPYRTLYAHGPLDTTQSDWLYARLECAPYLAKMFPGFSACGRCAWPWAVVRGHLTYDGIGGCFPLCEDCWQELRTPESRMPYYMQLVDEWERHEDQSTKREVIRRAVLREGNPDAFADEENPDAILEARVIV